MKDGWFVVLINKKKREERIRLKPNEPNDQGFKVVTVSNGTKYNEAKVEISHGGKKGWVEYDDKFLVLKKAAASAPRGQAPGQPNAEPGTPPIPGDPRARGDRPPIPTRPANTGQATRIPVPTPPSTAGGRPTPATTTNGRSTRGGPTDGGDRNSRGRSSRGRGR